MSSASGSVRRGLWRNRRLILFGGFFAALDGKHEIYLTCEDVTATVRALEKQKVKCDPVTDQRWGLLTHLTLPGGGQLGLYQPKHPVAAEKPA